MHRLDEHHRCPACGGSVDDAALAVPTETYRCPSCWTHHRPEQETEQIRLVAPGSTAPSEDDEPVTIPDADSIGATLREARHVHDVSISMASTATRIPERYLHALEEDAPPETFPGRTYERSFLREYARLLKLDDVPLLRRLDVENGDGEDEPAIALVPDAPRPRGTWRGKVVVALAIAALAAIVVSFRPWTSATPNAPLPSVSSVVAPPAEEPAGPAAPEEADGRETPPVFRGVLVELRVAEATYVEATADGDVELAETLEAGRRVRVRARDDLELVLGHASGVRLTVNDERVPLPSDGEVVELSLRWNGNKVTGL
ncbi:MAG: RodZ domain-containing protein [Actinomycetota bacterium]